jgi:hypothetical protein
LTKLGGPAIEGRLRLNKARDPASRSAWAASTPGPACGARRRVCSIPFPSLPVIGSTRSSSVLRVSTARRGSPPRTRQPSQGPASLYNLSHIHLRGYPTAAQPQLYSKRRLYELLGRVDGGTVKVGLYLMSRRTPPHSPLNLSLVDTCPTLRGACWLNTSPSTPMPAPGRPCIC